MTIFHTKKNQSQTALSPETILLAMKVLFVGLVTMRNIYIVKGMVNVYAQSHFIEMYSVH